MAALESAKDEPMSAVEIDATLIRARPGRTVRLAHVKKRLGV